MTKPSLQPPMGRPPPLQRPTRFARGCYRAALWGHAWEAREAREEVEERGEREAREAREEGEEGRVHAGGGAAAARCELIRAAALPAG